MPAVEKTPVVPADFVPRPSVSTTSARPRRAASAWRAFVLFLRVMRANPLTLVGFVLVMLVAGVTVLIVLVPLITQPLLGHALTILPYPATNPNYEDPALGATAPSAQHWLGTDPLGRDMFSRVLAALPTDLGIGFAVAGFALLVGGSLGLVAGYWDRPRTASGALSVSILRITDIFLSFPTLILALSIAATLGRGEFPSMFAVMATWWPYYVRLTRGEVLTIKNQPYCTAARAAGVSDTRILFRHVLRNLLEPLMVYFTMDVGTVIVTYSTISFIGIGVPVSIPEWGNMIQDYQEYLLTYPWTVLAVAGAIFVTVLAFSLLGDGLRDLLDPRSRRILTQTAAPAPMGGLTTTPLESSGAMRGPAPLAAAGEGSNR